MWKFLGSEQIKLISWILFRYEEKVIRISDCEQWMGGGGVGKRVET